MTHGARHQSRTAGVAALVGVLILVTAGSAVAHTELVGSTPADGATVPVTPAEVILEFNQPVQTQFGQVAVLDASDGHHEQGDPKVIGAAVTQGVDALAPGVYRITYRVGSADGHPVTGTLTFTIAAAAPSAAAPSETSSPAPSTSPSSHPGHTNHSATAEPTEPAANTSATLIAGSGIVAVVLAAVAYILLAGRRPQKPREGDEAETFK
jgi:copper resistance protein C